MILPPSFLSLTLCIFFMFNKVLSVVTTYGCVEVVFWWTSVIFWVTYAVMLSSELILFTFQNDMLHSCSREQNKMYASSKSYVINAVHTICEMKGTCSKHQFRKSVRDFSGFSGFLPPLKSVGGQVMLHCPLMWINLAPFYPETLL